MHPHRRIRNHPVRERFLKIKENTYGKQQEKKYGYELLVEMSQKSKGFFKVKEGTLYPILYKLEEDGLVISEWEIPHDKMRVKKYYSITQKGKDELKELIVFWNLLSTKVQDFLLEDNEYEE